MFPGGTSYGGDTDDYRWPRYDFPDVEDGTDTAGLPTDLVTHGDRLAMFRVALREGRLRQASEKREKQKGEKKEYGVTG